MTYIDYLNQFWRLFRREPCSIPESALYFFLLHIANEAHWTETWNCSNEYILAHLDISRSTLKRAKKSLKERGLIDYQSTIGRGNSCIYRLLEKGSQKTLLRKKGSTENPFNEEKGPEKGSDLDPFSKEKEKLTKEKEINKDKDNSLSQCAHTREEINILDEPPVEQAPLIMIKDLSLYIHQYKQSWIELFCMNNEIQVRDFNIMTDLFIKKLENEGIKSKTIADYQKHFANWFLIQKQNRNAKRTNNPIEQKQQLTNAQTSALADRLRAIDADYLREQSGEGTETDLPDSDTTDSRLLPENGEYPFG